MRAPDGEIRAQYRAFAGWLERTASERIAQKREEAERAFHRVGITFAVYGEDSGAERLIPFDLVPRIIAADEWKQLDRGLKQRVQALNAFLHDIYHDQAILKAGIVPSERVLTNSQYRPEMQGVDVPGRIYAHIAGVDIVRAGEGEYYVLEDNLRIPSGVSYMLENRKMMMRLFPELFATQRIRPVQHYPDLLLANLHAFSPVDGEQPTVTVLTPGAHNSAYFEHAFPGAADGRRTGRGSGSLRPQQHRLYAHHPRAAAGPCDLPARRRRLSRSAGVQQGIAARGARPIRRFSCGAGNPGQRDRHRRGRRQIDLPLRAGDDPLLSFRGAGARQRADLRASPQGRV
jgi:hypothetical protein